MKAFIRKPALNGNNQYGYLYDTSNRYDAKHKWVISDKAAEIFEADDQGDAVFISDGNEDTLFDLENKFPAPPGFTYFLDVDFDKTIYELNIPIALESTSWDAIYKQAETSTEILVANKGASNSQRGINPRYQKTFPLDVYYTTYCAKADHGFVADHYDYLAGFNNRIIGLWSNHRYPGFCRVRSDPKRARRLQGSKKRSTKIKTPAPPQLKDMLLISDLRELHKAFLAEYLPIELFTLSSSLKQNHAFQEKTKGLSKTQAIEYTRKLLVKEISRLRQLCNQSRKNWRAAKHNPYYGESNFYVQFLRRYEKAIPPLLKHKNNDYQVFGKWLRYERNIQRRAEKLARETAEKQPKSRPRSKKKVKKKAALPQN